MLLFAGLTISSTTHALTWTQVNEDGFGDDDASFSGQDFFAFVEYKNCLYAGIEAQSTTEGSRVYKSCNGTDWEQVNEDGFGDPVANDHVDSMQIFNGQLYVSNGTNSSSGATVYRTSDGADWTQVNVSGFGDGNNQNFKAMSVFQGNLCGGTYNATDGAEVWCTTDGTNWNKKSTDGFGDTNNIVVWTSVIFDGYLYFNTQNNTDGGEVWRTNDLSTWAQVGTNGFGYGSGDVAIAGWKIFNGALYGSKRDGSGGAEIIKSIDGVTFNTTYTFADTTNNIGASLGVFLVHDGYMYIETSNTVTGTEIWRTSNGTDWEQVNEDGFGDTNNRYGVFHSFGDHIYIGVGNYISGHRIYRTYLPLSSNIAGPITFNKDTKCRWEVPPQPTWIKLEPEEREDSKGMLLTWTQYSADKMTIKIDDGTGSFPWKIHKTENDGHEFLANVQSWQNIVIKPINHCNEGEYSITISLDQYPEGWFGTD